MIWNISKAFQNLSTSVRTVKPVDTLKQHSFNLFRSKILSDHDQIWDKKNSLILMLFLTIWWRTQLQIQIKEFIKGATAAVIKENVITSSQQPVVTLSIAPRKQTKNVIIILKLQQTVLQFY